VGLLNCENSELEDFSYSTAFSLILVDFSVVTQLVVSLSLYLCIYS